MSSPRSYADPYSSPRQGGGLSTPAAPGTSYTPTTQLSGDERAELHSVKSRLKSLVFELDEETARRIQVDAALQHEREMVMSPKNAKLLRSRDAEIAELKEEVDTMKKWLQKGVAEAHRIAADITETKAILDEVRAEEADAEAFNANVRAAESKLSTELTKQIEIRDSLMNVRDNWLTKVSDANQQARALAVETTKLNQSKDTYTSKQVNLKSGARRLEVIEVAMSCLGAALRRAEHTTKKIQGAMNSGNPKSIDPSVDDGFDSEDDAPSSTFPPKVAISGQEGARRMAAELEGISERFKRFTIDELSREDANTKAHMSRLAAEKAALETIRTQRDSTLYEDRVLTNELEQEREELLAFLQGQQERNQEIVNSLQSGGQSGHESPMAGLRLDDTMSDGGHSDISFSFMKFAGGKQNGSKPVRLTVVEQITEQVRLYREEIEKTKKNTIKWEGKVSSQDTDYASVKKLRTAFRDLESKKTLLGVDIREMEDLNKELKLFILQFSDTYTTPPM